MEALVLNRVVIILTDFELFGQFIGQDGGILVLIMLKIVFRDIPREKDRQIFEGRPLLWERDRAQRGIIPPFENSRDVDVGIRPFAMVLRW